MSTRWKRVGGFYALTFALLAAVPAIDALFGGGWMDFDAAAARASEQTGLPWTSNLAVILRFAFVEPSLWLLIFGSAVPSLAALIWCAALRPSPAELRPPDAAARFAELRALISRLRPRVSWRQAVPTYSLLVISVVAALVATYALRGLVQPETYSRPPDLIGLGLISGLALAALFDQGAVLEELGWRGYAQTELQRGRLDPLRAALLVGVAWGLWHVPRDVVSGVVERLGALEYLLLFLPSFVAGTVTVSIVAAYFVNRCNGSVLPAIVVHGLSNDAIGLSGAATIELALTPAHQITRAIPFAILALVIVALAGKRLGRRSRSCT